MVEKTRVIGKVPERAAWLYVLNSQQAGRDYRLQAETTIGRDDATCEVILTDSQLSAEHARIRREGNSYVLYDLASRNGTTLNGECVQRHILSDNDVLQLGATRLIFKVVPNMSQP